MPRKRASTPRFTFMVSIDDRLGSNLQEAAERLAQHLETAGLRGAILTGEHEPLGTDDEETDVSLGFGKERGRRGV